MRIEKTITSVNTELGGQFLEMCLLEGGPLKSACPIKFLQPWGTDADNKLPLFLVGGKIQVLKHRRYNREPRQTLWRRQNH
jgi:hypothetical protein